MAKLNIGDDILYNILARLPGKSLLRFRCVSKHWNCLISNPYLMKLRSRRMILLPFPRPLVVIDDNVAAEDKVHSMVRIRSPVEHQEGTHVSVDGTVNGIVLLTIYDTLYDTYPLRCRLILYNPLTCVSKTLLVMDPPCNHFVSYEFGFGYGATTDDLKIVRIEPFDHPNERVYRWDVFDIKTSSWSKPQSFNRYFQFGGDAGTFLNGFLYWSTIVGILSFNVKEMVFSKVRPPHSGYEAKFPWILLGSLDGCLCIIHRKKTDTSTVVVRLMKEEGVWLIVRSFRFSLEGRNVVSLHLICILGDGKILIKSSSNQHFIYNPSYDSYKALNGLETLDDGLIHFKSTVNFKHIRSIEYVESLVSPYDIC